MSRADGPELRPRAKGVGGERFALWPPTAPQEAGTANGIEHHKAHVAHAA
jgi:hypothetical protein